MTWLRVPLLPAPWPPGAPASACMFCGGYWKPWPGSRLPCHARCIWSPEGALALATDLRTDRELAAAIGTTISVVRAGRRAGERLRYPSVELTPESMRASQVDADAFVPATRETP